jgi:hypothetical protein
VLDHLVFECQLQGTAIWRVSQRSIDYSKQSFLLSLREVQNNHKPNRKCTFGRAILGHFLPETLNPFRMYPGVITEPLNSSEKYRTALFEWGRERTL